MTPARAAFEADLKAKIAGTILEPHFKELLGQVKAHINIHLERVELEDILYGASRMAGSPDLPPNFEWPEYEDEPLNFIAQFNLEHVALYDTFEQLPKTGMLSFFHHELGTVPEDSSAWRVCLHPLEGLVRREPPQGLNRQEYPCVASFETTYVFPLDNGLFEYESDEYEAVQVLREQFLEPKSPHLLGHCTDLSAFDMEDVLFEIFFQDLTNQVTWFGAVVFCIGEADLEARNFEEVWVETTSD